VNAFLEGADQFGVDSEAVAEALDTESEDFDEAVAAAALTEFASQFSDTDEVVYTVTVDEEILETEDQTLHRRGPGGSHSGLCRLWLRRA